MFATSKLLRNPATAALLLDVDGDVSELMGRKTIQMTKRYAPRSWSQSGAVDRPAAFRSDPVSAEPSATTSTPGSEEAEQAVLSVLQ